LRSDPATEYSTPDEGEELARPGGFAWAVAACVLTTALALVLRGTFAEANLILLYLLAVVFVTVRYGRKPGILASILAVLAFDVFLVPPYLSLTVADSQYLLTFAIMLVVSLIISHLTANLRLQAQIARHRERRANALFDLSRELSGALSNEQIGDISVRRLSATFRARAFILVPGEAGNLVALGEGSTSRARLADTALVIAKLVYEREVAIGYDEGATTSAGIQYVPLRAPMRTRGVLVLVPADPAQRLIPEQERLLRTCAAQIALAIERVHYVDVAQDATLAIESERLRNSLLSAVSHDVRTPLTAIIGFSSTLVSANALPDETRHELALAIQDAAIRMSRLVTNLLDMARLHAGAIQLNRQWQMLEEVVGSALAELSSTLAGLRVEVSVPASLPLLSFDAVLLERVFCNLLDNAAKYGAVGGSIGVAAQLVDDTVQVSIEDNGPGLPHGMEDAIFSKFTRGELESARAGVGLGLAICTAIVEAHGGKVWAGNRPEGGARFTFTLPLGSPPSDEGFD
jgi:two-component system, OmpR family, sensor histidine kinase KdpD